VGSYDAVVTVTGNSNWLGGEFVFTNAVTVNEAPPAAPGGIWASTTNLADFTAAWSAVSGATSYRLDVSPSNFQSIVVVSTVFRETMGTPTGTTSVAAYEAADGFDNDLYAMSSGGIGKTSDVRITSASTGYVDPTNNTASGSGNIYFTSTAGDYGFAIAGVDASGYDSLRLSFAYRKEVAASNAEYSVEWSTNNGTGWGAIALSNMPAATAAAGWYMVSNLHLPSAATGTNLTLRWVKTSNLALRVDDVLLQGVVSGSVASSYVPGYSNRTVSGTAQSVTGLTRSTTYYFRARAVSAGGTGAYSSVATVMTRAGAPPAMNPVSNRIATVGADFEYTVTATETDGDIVRFACTSLVNSNVWLFDTNSGYLLFIPTTNQLGSNVFSFTASDRDGSSSPVAMTVTVSAAASPFDAWVVSRGQNPASSNFVVDADYDRDGMTTWEEYLADTDPALSGSVLRVTGTYSLGVGQIRLAFPASTGRYYQLVFSTNLFVSPGVSNLGWGVPGMVVTNNTPGLWYGGIRSRLTAP
jgi:hypothetical protein